MIIAKVRGNKTNKQRTVNIPKDSEEYNSEWVKVEVLDTPKIEKGVRKLWPRKMGMVIVVKKLG